MQEKYSPEIFEKDKDEFINNFSRNYYSYKEYNSSLDLICSFDTRNKKFEIFSLSQNSYIPKNTFVIFRIKDWVKIDDDYDFSDLNKEIYEIFKSLNRKEILDYIKNNKYNLYKIEKIDEKNISKLLLDIEEVSKEDYESDEFISSLMYKNYYFYNYLIYNLYKWYYVEWNEYNNEIDLLINQIESLRYDNIFNIDVLD